MVKKSMILVKCPSCGANAKLTNGNICECEYCGATFLVTTSSEEATNVIASPSEADLKSNQINILVEKCEDAINKPELFIKQ